MIKFGPSTSAFSEPRTAATATTSLPRFFDGAAFRAYQIDCRGRGCSCVCWHLSNDKEKNAKTIITAWYARRCIYLHGVSLGLTFAGLATLRPSVISVSVVGTSTIFKPSTARSATAHSAGFLERAALWAHHLIGRGDELWGRADWCGDWRTNYF